MNEFITLDCFANKSKVEEFIYHSKDDILCNFTEGQCIYQRQQNLVSQSLAWLSQENISQSGIVVIIVLLFQMWF